MKPRPGSAVGQISREAEYYGAMDGANKFVRGDAIAGIIITFINIMAGLAIGVFQKDMNFRRRRQDVHPAHRGRWPGHARSRR
jgi:flagellar biosynthesis component FlhA